MKLKCERTTTFCPSVVKEGQRPLHVGPWVRPAPAAIDGLGRVLNVPSPPTEEDRSSSDESAGASRHSSFPPLIPANAIYQY